MSKDSHEIGDIFTSTKTKCTYKVVKVKSYAEDRLLLNCIIEVIAKSDDGDYLCTIEKENESHYRILDLKVFNSRATWLNFLGTASWFGNQNDLEVYKALLFKENHFKNLKKVMIGNQENCLVYKNTVCFQDKGKISKHEFDGQFVFEKNDCIYFTDTSDNNKYSPFSSYEPTDLEEFSFEEFYKVWTSQFKNKVLLNCLLGWNLAIFFMDQVKKARKEDCFPFFFLCGLTQAGKTALLKNNLKFFGLGERCVENYTETSAFVECFMLSRVSQIPLVRDEFRRQGKYVVQRESLFRSLYSGDEIMKGTADQKLKRYLPKTTWLLSGEDVPSDPAISRRCIVFRVDKEDKIDVDEFINIQDSANTLFPTALLYAFKQGFNAEVFKRIYKQPLMSENDQREEKTCYATLGAVFGEELGMKALTEASAFWKKRLEQENRKNKESDTASAFIEDLISYFVEKDYFECKYNQDPKVFEYIRLDENEIMFKYGSLIKMVLGKMKNYNEAQLSPLAVRNCLIDKYKGIVKPVKITDMPTKNALVIELKNISENDIMQDLILEMRAAEEKQNKVKDKQEVNSFNY